MIFFEDVIGQVMDLGDLETIQVSGKPRMKVEFTLRDMKFVFLNKLFFFIYQVKLVMLIFFFIF